MGEGALLRVAHELFPKQRTRLGFSRLGTCWRVGKEEHSCQLVATKQRGLGTNGGRGLPAHMPAA